VFFSEKLDESGRKITFWRPKLFKIRDFVFKIRQLTHFPHQITQGEHRFAEVVVSLHQKKILMVKVYG
jgi:hypothetical protein